MYNERMYKEQTKAMASVAMGVLDQRKTQYPGYHIQQPHQDSPRGQFIPATSQPAMTHSQLAYPPHASHIHNQQLTTQGSSTFYYGSSKSSDSTMRYSASQSGHLGSLRGTVTSPIAVDTQKHAAVYGGGSIQSGLPITGSRAERAPPLAIAGYPRTIPDNSLGPLRVQTSQTGSINAGLIVSYPNSVPSGLSQNLSQNRSGLTGVFKIGDQTHEYKHHIHDAKATMMREKQSPATSPRSSGSIYPSSMGYQPLGSVPHSQKQTQYPMNQASQAVRMPTPSQSSAIQSGLQAPNRQSPARQNYHNHAGHYGSLQSPTGSHQRQMLNESAYLSPKSSAPVSYSQTMHVSADSHRRVNSSMPLQSSQQLPQNQNNQRVVMSSSMCEKRHSMYPVPVSHSNHLVPATHKGSVPVQEFSARRTDVKDLHTKHVIQPIHKGSIQTGVPLDLTSVDVASSNRGVESPLDLSVKTRKRCADTTDDCIITDGDSRGVSPAKKMCVKTDSPVDLRAKEYPSKVLTATVPQPQKYTYDIEGAQRFDIKIQQNTFPGGPYLAGNKYDYVKSQGVACHKSDIPVSKSEFVSRYCSPHERQISQIPNYSSRGSVKSPITIQSKFEDQKVCYPSPPEVDAYPSLPQKSLASHPLSSSQSAIFTKASSTYLDTNDYRRVTGYGQNTSQIYKSSADIQATTTYQKPVSSCIVSQNHPQHSTVHVNSSVSNYKEQAYAMQQRHHQLLHQQQQQQQQQDLQHQNVSHNQQPVKMQSLTNHPQVQSHIHTPNNSQSHTQVQQHSHHQRHQQPLPPQVSQYYASNFAGNSKSMSSNSLSSSQSISTSKSALQSPRKTDSVDKHNKAIVARPVTTVSQPKPFIEMKLPSSSGYMVSTQEKRPIPKPHIVSTTLYKPPVSDVQTVQPAVKSEISPSSEVKSAPLSSGQKSQSRISDTKSEKVDIQKFTEPLSISIPHNPSNSSEQKAAGKSVQPAMPHKILSKKHRILNALSQEEDQKRVATNMPAPGTTHVHRSVDQFKMPTISPSSPASPKMPILSPHDKIPIQSDNSVHNEPPQLDPPATPVKNKNGIQVTARGDATLRSQDKLVKDKDVLIKGSQGKGTVVAAGVLGTTDTSATDTNNRENEKYVRQEVVRRNSLPVRPSMYQKNIPVANVAPFVHSNKDNLEPHSEANQLASEDVSQPNVQLNQEAEVKEPRTKKQTQSRLNKRQKEPNQSCLKKSAQYMKRLTKLGKTSGRKTDLKVLAPLKYKLLKATTEIQQLEESALSRKNKKKVLRPRQKKLPIQKGTKLKRKPVKVSKKTKQEVVGDSDGFEPSKQPLQKEEIQVDKAKKEESPSIARQERALRRAVIKIDRLEHNNDKPVKVDQPPSPTRRTVSNVSKRAQELKRKAIDGPHRRGIARRPLRRASLVSSRFTDFQPRLMQTRTRNQSSGRRRVAQYNRNAAYEKELRKDESRRALNRAKRRARIRRVTRHDTSYQEEDEYDDEDDEDTDGCWEISKSTSSQRLNIGRSKGGLMMKLYFRGPQETVTTRGRRTRQGLSTGNTPTKSTKQTKGKTRPRGKVKPKGKFQSQFEQFLKQDYEPENSILDDSYEHFADDEYAEETYQVRSEDGGSFVSYPMPPEMKKLAINKNSGETMLHRAARLGYEDVALYCMRTGSVDVNARDNAGYTALHESCVKGMLKVARQLIEHGADVNCCSQDGIRPIHDAVENDHVEIVRVLLSYGADPSIATYGGKTPIKIANSKAMKILIHGYLGDINGFDSENQETAWEFNGSGVLDDSFRATGFDIFADMPSDPEDETGDLFDVEMTSAIRTYDLHLDSSARLDPYVCVRDVMADFRLTKEDLKKICANKIQLHKISAKELCKSTERNVLTFCQQTVSPVELMKFEDFKTVESLMVEHLRKTEAQNKSSSQKIKKRPSTPSKKVKKPARAVESSDNESDDTVDFSSLYNSDDDSSVDFTDRIYSSPDKASLSMKSTAKSTPKHELSVQLKRETFPKYESPKPRRRSLDNSKSEPNCGGKHQGKAHLVYSSKSDSNIVFKTKLGMASKSKSDHVSNNKGIHISKNRGREGPSHDASKASMKAQSEHIYSFDEHDSMCLNNEDPEITFPRMDRIFLERGEKHSVRKERTVDCKKGLEKSFRTIMSNSKEDHFRIKIGTVTQASQETSRGAHSGSDAIETLSVSHNHIKS